MARAVPPVERSRMPSAARPRANSIRPVLSETDSRAWVTCAVLKILVSRSNRWRSGWCSNKADARVSARAGRGSGDPVRLQFVAQRRAIDAEHVGSLRLVAVGAFHHVDEQCF